LPAKSSAHLLWPLIHGAYVHIYVYFCRPPMWVYDLCLYDSCRIFCILNGNNCILNGNNCIVSGKNCMSHCFMDMPQGFSFRCLTARLPPGALPGSSARFCPPGLPPGSSYSNNCHFHALWRFGSVRFGSVRGSVRGVHVVNWGERFAVQGRFGSNPVRVIPVRLGSRAPCCVQ
jgi:hypothetical protein